MKQSGKSSKIHQCHREHWNHFGNTLIFLDINISENTSARLLATNSNYRYVKCIDVYPKSESDLLLAVGQANGKVSLTTFGPSVFDSVGLAGVELSTHFICLCIGVF